MYTLSQYYPTIQHKLVTVTSTHYHSIKGAVCLIDNVLVYSSTQSEHDLTVLSEAGLTVNKLMLCYF